MRVVNVTGYCDGVAYGIALDDGARDPLTGVIIAAPPRLISMIEAATGEYGWLTPVGGDTVIGIDSIDGVLAYLLARTQVLTVDGDLPEALTEDSAGCCPRVLSEPDTESMTH